MINNCNIPLIKFKQFNYKIIRKNVLKSENGISLEHEYII